MNEIEKAFDQFYSRLLPDAENDSVADHRGSIKECLIRDFNLSNFFQVGSHINGTGIKGFSHTDYFAVIHPGSLSRDSTYTLRRIKDVLVDRFSLTHNIHVYPPGVVVPFGIRERETTRIIPAEFLRRRSGCNIYEIPDRKGGWMTACPDAHNDYLTLANLKRKLRVKPLIRYIKAIKHEHKLSINSFYLEIFIARFALGRPEIIIPDDIWRVLNALYQDEIRDIYDPLKISGEIFPCQNEIEREEATRKIAKIILDLSDVMILAEKGKTAKSFSLLERVFGDRFPSYRSVVKNG